MLVDIFQRAERLLREDILLSLTDDELGVTVNFDNIVDELANEDLGYGFLNDPELRKDMDVMKAFMNHPKFKDHFYIRDGEKLVWVAGACRRWLGHVKQFKELIYVLVHILGGMPKRGSEEARIKHTNLGERVRNIFYMLSKLAFVGNYSKTSALTGSDRITLHFAPDSVTSLIMRFFSLAADMEKRFVKDFCPDASSNWECYMYSSFGKIWKSNHLARILKRETLRYLGKGFGIADLRHLLPAIAEHYHVGFNNSHEGPRHSQKGHSAPLSGRLYSRTIGSHPALTSDVVRETLRFSEEWQSLLGFPPSTSGPSAMTGREMHTIRKTHTERRDSELATIVSDLMVLITSMQNGTSQSSVSMLSLNNIQQSLDTFRSTSGVAQNLLSRSSSLPISNPIPTRAPSQARELGISTAIDEHSSDLPHRSPELGGSKEVAKYSADAYIFDGASADHEMYVDDLAYLDMGDSLNHASIQQGLEADPRAPFTGEEDASLDMDGESTERIGACAVTYVS